MTFSFDSLPNEIVLAIVTQVPFSYESFGALRLANRKTNTLMLCQGRKLLEDIAEVQVPSALWASSHPPVPFNKSGVFYLY
jgi:hypothetical protein